MKKFLKYAVPVGAGILVGAFVGDKIPLVGTLVAKVKESIAKAKADAAANKA
ncbi:hypothetical protein OH491_17475 [Termitidicoccus mucosus]|uniref:hypothetical protein n=1 Tax=Termitidicoccus mucosus TaxID=1184151 RepID=UPI00267F334C